MKVGMAWLSSPTSLPSRTHLKNCLPSSVLMFQAHAIHLVHCNPMRDEYKPPLNTLKEDGPSQEASDRKQMEMETSFNKEDSDESDQLPQKFERQLFYKPVFWNMVPPSQTQETGSSYMTVQSSNASKLSDMEPAVTIKTAEKALLASKEVAPITKNSTDLDSVSSGSSSNFALDEENIVVRSTRHLERISKTRRVSKTKAIAPKPHNSKRINIRRKNSEGYGSNSNDAIQSFLRGQGTTQRLTRDEESKLAVHVGNLRNLERVKRKLQSSLGREPTMAEWAQDAGISRKVLLADVRSGIRSRQKLFSANLWMVVRTAERYQDEGLSLEDLMQAGCLGLLKTFEKFKPRDDIRFGTYAFWWIRYSIQKAISCYSTLIRLPNLAYYDLRRIKKARIACFRKGNYNPTSKELARRTGLSVHKLEMLLLLSRPPTSLHGLTQSADGRCHYVKEEDIEDTEHDTPDVIIEKEMMRQHIHGILNTLKPRERRIMILRFGFEDGRPKSLSEIAVIFGLSKQLIWKMECRAMVKLKGCIDEQGLEAYAHLVV
nr:plastidic RNA polymerase sigma-subunit 6 [Passiflora auriculata]